ncbi:hypothetical protein OED52_10190 [Rhodococcus sp. Z13]|uniref:Uncharacterized protein n=1 Tax=Rhodococcus sacchari TaxID=2962047 RepID=A0ACD4DLD8_9NOCA|nr:hypothetical protein [Rhodococcus sp. Z13]UYP20852.1 hypothetical protein OED52_10190 [Rhodococcus sp. Z13]
MSMQRHVGPRSGTVWADLFGDLPDHSHEASAQVLRAWIGGYLVEPHPDLGRAGPVCPFVRPSVEKHLFGVAFVHGAHVDAGTLTTIVADQYDLYLRLVDEDDRDRTLKALATVLPDLTDFTVIDEVHAGCKSRFVERGCMLGQFYPGCSQPGLWNHDFHPLDAPLPMLVARNMMTTDFPFLMGRPEWLRAYFKKFAPGLPSALRLILAKRMTYEGDVVEAITAHHEMVGNEQAH